MSNENKNFQKKLNYLNGLRVGRLDKPYNNLDNNYFIYEGEPRVDYFINEALQDPDIIIPGGEKPEVVVIPSKADRLSLELSKTIFPRKWDREQFIEGLQSISHRNKSQIHMNDQWLRLSQLRALSNYPTLDRTKDVANYVWSYFPMGDPEFDKTRAHYNPLTNTIIAPKMRERTQLPYVAELAHAYQFQNDKARKNGLIGNFRLLPADVKINGKTEYETPGSVEWNAHKVIEPYMLQYLTDADFTLDQFETILTNPNTTNNSQSNVIERFRKHRRGGILKFQNSGIFPYSKQVKFTPIDNILKGEEGIVTVNPKQFAWSGLGQYTNRYNQSNDQYLNEIFNLSKKYGYNDYQISAIIANAIQENGGSPLANNGKYGLFQFLASQKNDVGYTVESSMKAFHRDYGYGRWYHTKDKNGWDPRYHKYFKDGQSPEDVAYGMAAGYERYGGASNKNNSETQNRMKLARAIYNIITQ